MTPTKILTIVGATGNVGRQVLKQIFDKGLIDGFELNLLASSASKGKTIELNGTSFTVHETTENSFKNSTLCLFNTEADISEKYVPIALEAGSCVLDSSSHYRLKQGIPLIIPPVNAHLIDKEKKLYALSNCLASPIAVACSPLHKSFGIKRINAVTFQSTSGAGKKAMDECLKQTQQALAQKSISPECYPKQIAFNVIPQIGSISANGTTTEEYKIIHELKKVLSDDIKITATAVRVPVMVGHSIALNVELNRPFELPEVIQTLNDANHVQLSKGGYSTPVEITNSDDVFVGRIRRDESLPNTLNLWLCSDNLRRGASTDAVELLTLLKSVYF